MSMISFWEKFECNGILKVVVTFMKQTMIKHSRDFIASVKRIDFGISFLQT